MMTFNSNTKGWNPSGQKVTHDELRAIVGKDCAITTSSDGLIAFEKDLSAEEMTDIELLMLTRRV